VPGGKADLREARFLRSARGGITMNRTDCLFEKVSHFGVGVALFLIAMGLSVISVVALPVIGFFIAAPVFFLAARFIGAPRSQECILR